MPIDAGRLDRKVTIQTCTPSVGTSGGVALTYATDATVSAQKVETTGRESRSAGALRAETDLVLRIRYRSTLTEKHRLYFEGRHYDILSITEEGRREIQVLQARFTEGAVAA